jgi:hypothetical protein
MSNEETIEGNKLIAEFMGYEEYNKTGAFINGESTKFVLSYDAIWGELMPVVKKIAIVFPKLNMSYDMGNLKNGLLVYVDIKIVWLAVVEFIKWYNQNKDKMSGINKIGVVLMKEGVITIQSARYIEDGWYIEIIGDDISLYEIPFGGGEPMVIGKYNTLLSAIEAANKLT